MNKPPFITFEGGEGAGKSTQVRLLKEWLQEQGISVVAGREPGATPGGEAIRDLLVRGKENRWDAKTDVLLFTAARRDHLVKLIWPSLERGDWVLVDRFVDSTYAYQSFGRGADLAELEKLYQFIGGDFKPDLTFLLDLTPEVGIKRTHKASGTEGRPEEENRFEGFDLSFHERLRAGYYFLAKREPERFFIINAETSIDDIQQQLRAEITRRFLAA